MVGVERAFDRDGRVLTVRDVTADDFPAVTELFDDLSPRSARQRFLSTSTRAGPQYVEALQDPARTLDAVVALVGARVVGVASTHPGVGSTVEFAVTVEDADQGHGIGTVLVEALVARSRRRGITTLSGTVLGGNAQMLDVLAHLGLPCRTVVEDGTADVEIEISSDAFLASAHLARRETARVAAVRPLLGPSSVAVLEAPGVSRPRRSLIRASPEVAVSLVTRVDGGYELVPGVELVVIPDWADDAGPAALACAAARVPAIVLLGRDGGRRAVDAPGCSRLSRGVVDRLLESGSRVLGPGTACLVNTDPVVGLQVGGPRGRVVAGVVGVVADDGRRLRRVLTGVVAHGLGISVAVDVGGAADLGVVDVVAWLAQDPRTEVIVVDLRGAAPPELVSQLARVHQTLKPVILRSATTATTAAITPTTTPTTSTGPTSDPGPERDSDRDSDLVTRGAAETVATLETGTGPVRAESIEDLTALAAVVVQRGALPGRRAVVVTNQPQAAGAAAQRALARGALLGPDLTQHSEMRIHFLAPGAATRGAVLALPRAATPEQVHDVLETLADDPGVDSLVVDLAPGAGLRRQSLDKVLRGLPSESSRGRPAPLVLAVDPRRFRHHGAAVPAFRSVAAALDVLERASHHQSD